MKPEIIAVLSDDPKLIEEMIIGLANTFGQAVGKSMLTQIRWHGVRVLEESKTLTPDDIELMYPFAEKYIENYVKSHGQLKVLGMGKPVNLDEVYTQVNFDKEVIQAFEVDKQEEEFRKRKWGKKECRSGMEVANDCPCLMVLGGPGMGKTTFLRKVGLEALKQKKKNNQYKHSCIPVFLELRRCRQETFSNIDLEAMIAEEFQSCGLLDYTLCTQKLLEQGKLLILFDGLDEVPMDLFNQVTISIQALVKRYDKNRFIASCRIIASYRPFQTLQTFSRFTDVAITDFDEYQIQCFIKAWFKSHNQVDWGGECWKKLNSDNHKATKELAKTPLLLTLICILHLKVGEFPTARAPLFKQAVWTLLAEWDASRAITRHKLYKDLDTTRKELMLSEIAYRNFIKNDYFFQEKDIIEQIKDILQEMLPEEKGINGRDMLLSVEEQHGILVYRYNDNFSFSHLTVQEFLTANHIIYESQDIDIKKLIKNHLCEKRWREVFLLMAGLKKADNILLAIEKESHRYMINSPKLQSLLSWVDTMSDSNSSEVQPIGKRAIAYVTAYVTAYAYAAAKAVVNARDKATTSDSITVAKPISDAIRSAISIAKPIPSTASNTIAIANAIANTYASCFELSYSNANESSNTTVLEYFIGYAKWAIKFKIYQEQNLYIVIDGLEKLRNQVPKQGSSRKKHHDFDKQLIEIFLKAFHLNLEMVDLCKEEIRLMENYIYANCLLMECEQSSIKRTTGTWEEIKGRMFTPRHHNSSGDNT
jgi:hypothetical protein